MIQTSPPERPDPPEGRIKWVRARLPFETGETPFKSAARQGGMFFYAVLMVGFAGLALYMAFIERHLPTGPYVMAPAVGAAWFAVRFVMQLRPRI